MRSVYSLGLIPDRVPAAAGFPAMAYENSSKLVIVNQQATEIDAIADVVIHSGIRDTLQTAMAQ
jgi:NAD-dependent SIR2 family protein deacetylase